MFNKKLKQEMAAAQEAIAHLSSEVSALRTEVETLRGANITYGATISALVEVNKRKLSGQNSTEPWVELLGDKLDNDNRLQVELDWNEAFVKHLKDQGFTGTKDDEVIRKWLSLLLDQIVGRMELNEIQENTDEPNKFV